MLLPIATVDFETYFDAKYSLKQKKYNTSGYIRDPKFKIQCVSIKLDGHPAQWFEGCHAEEALRDIDWNTTALLCHNTNFDGFILSHHFGIVPCRYLDTLSMARAVHSNIIRAKLAAVASYYKVGNKLPDVLEKTKGVVDLPKELLAQLGQYCTVDAELCYLIYQKLLPHFSQAELDLIDLTVRMFCDPVLEVDIPRAESSLRDEMRERAEIIARAGVDPKVLRSRPQFIALLTELGVTVPEKISPHNGKKTAALAKGDLNFQDDLVKHPDEKIRTLVQARLVAQSSIDETRAKRLLVAGENGLKLPVLLNYHGAHTSRWTAGNRMNMQNLRRDGELRKAIIAPAEHVIVSCDSAQIEARTLAWLAEHTELLNLFAAGVDIYKRMAAYVFNKPEEQVTDDERFVGKVCMLGLGYGMGIRKFNYTLATGQMGRAVKLKIGRCAHAVGSYRITNKPIVELWQKMQEILITLTSKKTGTYKCLEYHDNKIFLPNGIVLQYPGLKGIWDEIEERCLGFEYTDADHNTKKIYGGLLTENITQALARIIVANQMLEISRLYRVVMMTHDEVVCVVPQNLEKQACEDMVRIMSTPMDWCPNLPLNAEVVSGRHYT